MDNKYVYGWYCYANGQQAEFRAPAAQKDNLAVGGQKVTVEVHLGGNWYPRRGVTVESNGNYQVVPAKH